jgi:hypothetical protein
MAVTVALGAFLAIGAEWGMGCAVYWWVEAGCVLVAWQKAVAGKRAEFIFDLGKGFREHK